jgi:nucleotide-binding universal stress UspA family protein
MHNSINTILIATDFTEKSNNAVRMALHIASRHHSRIFVLHNINNYFVIDRTGKQVLGSDIIKENLEKAQTALTSLKSKVQEQYPDLLIETVIKNDSLIHGINEVVDLEDVDLVISGTSGKQNFTQVVLGSMSYEILTGVNCSVLLVPESCEKYAFERILVPIRVMDDLFDKIDLSLTIAKKNKGVINLLGISSGDDINKIRNAYQQAKKTLDYKAQEYHSQFLLTRDKASQISRYSKEDEADIIILNYQDENSWKSFFLENFFKQVINNTDIPLFFLKNKYTKKADEQYGNAGFDITLPSPG